MIESTYKLISDLEFGQINKEEFENEYGVPEDGWNNHIIFLLNQEREEKDWIGIRGTVFLVFQYGNFDQLKGELFKLMSEQWHRSHEDLLVLLEHSAESLSIDAIYDVVLNPPAYSRVDENHTLEKNCIHSLANIGSEEAIEKLIAISTMQKGDLSALALRLVRELTGDDTHDDIGLR